MKKVVMIVVLLCGLLNVTGCQSDDKKAKPTEKNTDGVIINDYNVKKLSLDVKKIAVNDDALATFKEKNSGENVTKDYVVQILLDKLYPVSKTEIAQIVANEKKAHDNWDDYLKTNNLTNESYSEEKKYTEQIKRLVTSSLVIDDKALKAFYDATITTNTSDIQHLLVNDKKTAEKIYQQLEQGDDFSALAKEYSLDTATKEQGGVWTDYRPGTSLEVVDEAIGKLTEVGQVSQPFQSVLGWHVVKLQDLKEAKNFEEIKDDVKTQYIESKMTFNYIKVLLDQLVEENLHYFEKDIQKEVTKEVA